MNDFNLDAKNNNRRLRVTLLWIAYCEKKTREQNAFQQGATRYPFYFRTKQKVNGIAR